MVKLEKYIPEKVLTLQSLTESSIDAGARNGFFLFLTFFGSSRVTQSQIQHKDFNFLF